MDSVILLDKNHIQKNIDNNIEIMLFESIDSTNDFLKTYTHTKTIKICLAEQQTHGRGRLNRNWYSPYAANIYLSCLFPFAKDVSELSGLSLVTGLAIFKSIKDFGLKNGLYVKWPNDILYEKKKLSGTLIDIQAELHGESRAIIGIGINVNILDDENQIAARWTSMRKILHQYIDRNELCIRLLNYLLHDLAEFNAQGLFPFIKQWEKADYLLNENIAIKNLDKTITGKMIGINDKGHLLLQLQDGTTRAFSSGDTTILKK